MHSSAPKKRFGRSQVGMYTYNNQVYAPSIDEMVSSFPENRQYFCQYINTRPHTIINIVNTTDIDNITDRVRSANENHIRLTLSY